MLDRAQLLVEPSSGHSKRAVQNLANLRLYFQWVTGRGWLGTFPLCAARNAITAQLTLPLALLSAGIVDILAAALSSQLAPPASTTLPTTDSLLLPCCRRRIEPPPTLRASISRAHAATVDPTSRIGRILDSLASIASQSAPNLRSHSHPRSHGSRTDHGVDHDLVTAEVGILLQSGMVRTFLLGRRLHAYSIGEPRRAKIRAWVAEHS
jgi:hypothetical protein